MQRMQLGRRVADCLVLAAAAISTPVFAQTGAGAAPVAVAAPQPARLAAAREFIAVAYPPEKRDAVFRAAIDSMLKLVNDVELMGTRSDPAMQALMQRHRTVIQRRASELATARMPEMLDAMAIGFARIFPPDELRELREFAATPTGQRYFEQSAAIMNDPDVIAAQQKLARDMMAELAPMREALAKDLRAYLAKKPGAGGKTAN